jgi:hypothetical protein
LAEFEFLILRNCKFLSAVAIQIWPLPAAVKLPSLRKLPLLGALLLLVAVLLLAVAIRPKEIHNMILEEPAGERSTDFLECACVNNQGRGEGFLGRSQQGGVADEWVFLRWTEDPKPYVTSVGGPDCFIIYVLAVLDF